MFDPEKVERFYTRNRKVGFVDASDYDQLLELYRKAMGFQFGPPYMKPKIDDPQTS